MEDKSNKHSFKIRRIDFKALWGRLRRIDRGEVAAKAADLTIDTVSVTLSSILKVFGSVLLVFVLTSLIFACIFAYYVKSCLSSTLDISLEDYQLSESSTIWYTDSTGGWKQLVTLTGKEKRIWVDYDKIPWYMEKALVAIEDKRFYEHKGVDWYRTAGAFVEMFARMSDTYGGSTITQQLIKNLTGKNEVTVQRKLSEIFGALELEKNTTSVRSSNGISTPSTSARAAGAYRPPRRPISTRTFRISLSPSARRSSASPTSPRSTIPSMICPPISSGRRPSCTRCTSRALSTTRNTGTRSPSR